MYHSKVRCLQEENLDVEYMQILCILQLFCICKTTLKLKVYLKNEIIEIISSISGLRTDFIEKKKKK